MNDFFSFSMGRTSSLVVAALALSAGPLRAAALRPAEISAEQAAEAPYRDSGRIQVQQGRFGYIGTASYIRRYTGLTAGHILYNPKTGLSTELYYQAGLYIQSTSYATVSYFAVLAGYQQAADQNGPDSDAAFGQDMGYLIFDKPAPNNEWVSWSANPGDLLGSGPFLLFGYAAESFEGDVLASVQHSNPYSPGSVPALVQNGAYYTEGGMSGGPVYVTHFGGAMTMAAINVAGTSYPERAASGARAITQADAPLLLAAEYDHGIIRGGVIKGPAAVAAGGTAKFKTGLIFPDGAQVKNAVATQYDGDLTLVANGPHKKSVFITKTKPAQYAVIFPASLAAGTQISLQLLRTALPLKGQTPLQTLTVTLL